MIHYRPAIGWAKPTFVLPVPVDPAGLLGPTRGQAAGPRWRRTSTGRHVPTSADPDVPEQRIAEAAGQLPAGAALTGWAVLRLSGGQPFDGLEWRTGSRRRVPLLLGPHNGRRRRAGVALHYDRLEEEVAWVRGLPCAPVERALFDEMRTGPSLREAVVAADMACTYRLVRLETFREYVEDRRGWSGVPLVRQALRWVDQHSASPQESRLRLLYQWRCRQPAPLVNVAVFDRDGFLLGYPDLLDVQAGLAIEYDGADHRTAARHSDDVEREARLRSAGLEVARVTSRQLRHPEQLSTRLLETRERVQARPPLRRWTLDPRGSADYCPPAGRAREEPAAGQ